MFFKYNLWPFLWSIIIIILCCIPGKEFPESSLFEVPHLDKIVHFVLHLILIVLILIGGSKHYSFDFLSNKYYLFSIIYGISLGGIIELIQHFFIPFRDGNLLDTVANIFGSLVGASLFYYRVLPKFIY